MSTEIFDRFYWECVFSNSHFMRFHHFLDGCTNITKPHIYTCRFDSFICCFFGSCEQRIKHGIESNSEGTINNMSIDLSTEVNFHNIIIAEHSVITWVRSVVSSTIVDTATCRKTNTLLEPIGFYKSLICFFNSLTNIDKFYSWSHVSLSHFSDLPMALSCFSEVIDPGLM